MNRTSKTFFTALTSLALLFPGYSLAAIDIENGSGGIMESMLASDAETFSDAIQVGLKSGHYARLSSVKLRGLRAKTYGATVARFEYRYTKHGVEQVRVYHARSGRSVRDFIGKFDSGYKSSSDGEMAPAADEADILLDAQESIYYPADTATDIRVARLKPKPGSTIDAVHTGETTADGTNKIVHGADAELKILRRIEYDIEDNVVASGGRITGYVSKTVCASCEKAMEEFTRKFDVHGKVYHLNDGKAIGGVELPGDLAASQASSKMLAETRKDYVKSLINQDGATPRVRSWTEDASRMARLEAEEAVEGIANAAGCES